MNNAFLLLIVINVYSCSDRFIGKLSYNIDRLYSTKVYIGSKTVDLIVSTTSGLTWVDVDVIANEGSVSTFNVLDNNLVE
jgi:hypothetical protein